jgi:hypothetical protein
LHFDSTDNELVQITKSFADSFIAALNLGGTISEEQILNALQQAHIASDGYYNVTHAQQWNTTFEFPPEAIAADTALLESCGNDFASMCRAKQSKLAHNRLSVRRVIDTFGPQGTRIPGMLPADFRLLLEFAQSGITPLVGQDFVPQATNLPHSADQREDLCHPRVGHPQARVRAVRAPELYCFVLSFLSLIVDDPVAMNLSVLSIMILVVDRVFNTRNPILS